MELLWKGMDAILWWSYQRADWWRGVIIKRVTFLGWMVIFISVISGIFGTDVMNNALGFLFFLGGVLFSVEFFSLFFRRQDVEVSFLGEPIGGVRVGEPVSIPFKVSARRPLRRGSFILYPWSTEDVSFSLFRNSREPGEEKRNPVDRFFKFYRWQWLLENRKKPFKAVYTPEWTGSQGEQELSLPITFQRRGVWPLVNLRAHLPGVFGLLERSCKTRGERGEIHVAPRVLPVRIVGGGGAGKLDTLSLETQSKAGDSTEFLSLREYRPGDSWRKINWKAMARTDKAMIQETEEPGVPAFLVRWETADSDAAEFELGASLVASLMTHLYAEGSPGGVEITHGEKRTYSWEDGMQEIMHGLAEMEYGDPWTEVEGEEEKGIEASVEFLIHAGESQGSPRAGEGYTLRIEGKKVNNQEVEKEFLIDG